MALIKSAVAAGSAQYWPLSTAMMVVTPIILLLLVVQSRHLVDRI